MYKICGLIKMNEVEEYLDYSKWTVKNLDSWKEDNFLQNGDLIDDIEDAC